MGGKAMKKKLQAMLCALSLLLVSGAYGGGEETYMEPDPIFKGRTNIMDGTGTRQGWIEKDPIYKDRYNVYDSKTGMRTGTTIEKNPVYKDRWDVKGSKTSKGGGKK